MPKLKLKDVLDYVENHIGKFHERRIEKIKKINLKDVLKAKNPYLYKAKNILTSQEIVENILSATMSSSEEGLFGNWLEGLAIFINEKVYKGRKSTSTGIDLEFTKDKVRYVVVIKSGPVWGNQSQLSNMYSNFNEAKRRLGTSGGKEQILFVNGCCYGKDNKPHKFPKKGPDYYKYCGQEFWEFVSGDGKLYVEIIEPLGYKAKEKNDEYYIEYANLVNKLTIDFSKEFCNENGEIKWEEIVKLNSARSVINYSRSKKNKVEAATLRKVSEKK